MRLLRKWFSNWILREEIASHDKDETKLLKVNGHTIVGTVTDDVSFVDGAMRRKYIGYWLPDTHSYTEYKESCMIIEEQVGFIKSCGAEKIEFWVR